MAPPWTAVQSRRVILPDGDGLRIAPARLTLDDGVILAVDEAPAPPGGGVLDLGEHLLGPAFVNAHTHVAMQGLRGVGGDAARAGNVVEDLWFRIEAALQPGDVRAFARIGALECLLTGTGAILDHYYAADEVADALVDVGIEGMVAPTLQDLGGPGADAWSEALQTTADLHESGRLRDAGVVAAVGPHATDTVSDVLWARASELARRLDLPVHVHVAQSFEEHRRARSAGHRSAVARLLAHGRLDGVSRALLVHLVLVDDVDLESLDPVRDVAVHCPRSQLQFAFPADVERLGRRLPLALGTDAGACNDAMDVQAELVLLTHGPVYGLTFDGAPGDLDRRVAHLEAARSAQQDARAEAWAPARALDAITRVPGAVHPAVRWGVIAPGARATLAAWDLDHPALWPARDPLRAIAFGASAAALHTLIVGGRVVGEVGDPRARLRDAEVRAHTHEATDRLRALLERAGVGGA